ncbi:MAG: deoxyribose-phosphate aldolase, partial [Gammaproteobacteria bacterium]|nr:deoxyribose-phosphate aldolase [Gammaproteobacteria bacterium]
MSSKHSEATNVVSIAGDNPTEGDVNNPGIEFNADLIKDIRINLSAIKSRTDSLKARRSLKKEWQTAWMLKAVSCIDLTTLSPQD